MKKNIKFKHKTGKIFKDSRGWLKKILDGNFSSCIEIYSKKDTTRANHYHKKDKHFIYIITGEILYFYKDRKKGSKVHIKRIVAEYRREKNQELISNTVISINKDNK